MNCPKCNSPITIKRQKCEVCGLDLKIYRKIIHLSNHYYNVGLEKAKVKDLSGAILVLKKSLELNKNNTNARNLLGLVYFETGETVSALSEWVISKHLQPEGNDADAYMESVQKNPTKLEALNQTIKKYNGALQSAKTGSEDLAIIQLKKVVSLNPHFVRALQLLALLYMKNGEMEKAKRYLVRAGKIDLSNTTTLRYLDEINRSLDPQDEQKKGGETELNQRRGDVSFSPISTYKEDKPNIMAFINLILGVIIGTAVVYFLVVPAAERKVAEEYRKDTVEINEQISSYTNEIALLKKDKATLEADVERLQTQLDGIEIPEYDEAMYDALFDAFRIYMEEIEKPEADRDMTKVAETLVNVKETALANETAKDLYNVMAEASYEDTALKLYEEGHTIYTNGKYQEALDKLLEAYQYDDQNEDIIYFIGRSYHRLGDNENAKKYYTMIVEDFADTARYREANSYLQQVQ